MKLNRLAAAFCLGVSALGIEAQAASPESWREYLAGEYAQADRAGEGAIEGAPGWYFLSAELHFLSVPQFWGEPAREVSRASKPELADPLPAIVDFQRQLKERGIELLLVPVPPKAALNPAKLAPNGGFSPSDALAPLGRFYQELAAQGVAVLDLAPILSVEGEEGPMYCRTDTHWSGLGCVRAAKAIAERVKPLLGAGGSAGECAREWKDIRIEGDLGSLLRAGTAKPEPETLRVRTVTVGGAGVQPDPHSPLLLLGDSHTLVFHDFLAEHAGLLDQLALELGFAPDLLGTRGSGATPVRINLYRRSVKDPGYLSEKKAVVWCFTAREFTESVEGWPKVPVAR